MKKSTGGLLIITSCFIADNILLSTVNNMDVVEAGFDLQSSPADASSGSSDNSDSSSDNSETCVPCTDTIETDGSSDENNEFMMQEVKLAVFFFSTFLFACQVLSC